MCETATSSSILNWNVVWTVCKDSSKAREPARIHRFFKRFKFFKFLKDYSVNYWNFTASFQIFQASEIKNQIFVLFLQYSKLLNAHIFIKNKFTNSKYRFFQPSRHLKPHSYRSFGFHYVTPLSYCAIIRSHLNDFD